MGLEADLKTFLAPTWREHLGQIQLGFDASAVCTCGQSFRWCCNEWSYSWKATRQPCYNRVRTQTCNVSSAGGAGLWASFSGREAPWLPLSRGCLRWAEYAGIGKKLQGALKEWRQHQYRSSSFVVKEAKQSLAWIRHWYFGGGRMWLHGLSLASWVQQPTLLYTQLLRWRVCVVYTTPVPLFGTAFRRSTGNHVKHQAFLASEMDSNVNQR